MKRRSKQLDWIDDLEFQSLHVEFCEWLAEFYKCQLPRTNRIVLSDSESQLGLFQWNSDFARILLSRDPDEVDGLIGGDSKSSKTICFDSWMSQHDVWKMLAFFRSAIRDKKTIIEVRHLDFPIR